MCAISIQILSKAELLREAQFDTDIDIPWKKKKSTQPDRWAASYNLKLPEQ